MVQVSRRQVCLLVDAKAWIVCRKDKIKDTCVRFSCALEKACWDVLGVAERNLPGCEEEKQHERKIV